MHAYGQYWNKKLKSTNKNNHIYVMHVCETELSIHFYRSVSARGRGGCRIYPSCPWAKVKLVMISLISMACTQFQSHLVVY